MDARRALAACAVVVAAGCARERDRSPEPSAKPPEVAVQPTAFEPWTPRLYVATAELVLRDCNDRSVPRVGSDEFDELVDVRNFEAFDRSDAPPMERLTPMMDLTDGMKSLMKAYGTCGHIIEFVAMTALLIEGYVRVLPATDEFLAGFSPEDPTYENRVAGRVRLLNGVHGMIYWTIGTLAEPQYDISRLDPLATRLGGAFAAAFRWLPPETVAVELGRLRDLVSQTSDPTRKAIIQKVLAAAE